MIDSLYNVVSIAIWGPFNEGWGQFDAAEIDNWTKQYDPTRLLDHASGWFGAITAAGTSTGSPSGAGARGGAAGHSSSPSSAATA